MNFEDFGKLKSLNFFWNLLHSSFWDSQSDIEFQHIRSNNRLKDVSIYWTQLYSHTKCIIHWMNSYHLLITNSKNRIHMLFDGRLMILNLIYSISEYWTLYLNFSCVQALLCSTYCWKLFLSIDCVSMGHFSNEPQFESSEMRTSFI